MRKKTRNNRSSDRKPAARTAPRGGDNFTWDDLVASVLRAGESGFRNGSKPALWDVVAFCEQSNVPKPEWARDALIAHAYEWGRTEGSRKKRGRPSNSRLDVYIYSAVEYWCEQTSAMPNGKARRFSRNLAYDIVQKELADNALSLSAEAIRAACARGKKILENPDSHVGPISEAFYLGPISGKPPIS